MARPFVPTENASTWNTIMERIGRFKPPIAIEDYIDFEAPKGLIVYDHPSVGFDFQLPKSKREELLDWLRNAQTKSSKKAFQEGRWEGVWDAVKNAGFDLANSVIGRTSKKHWAADISFKSTKGIGFRQIWYLELEDRPLRMANLRPVGDTTPQLDSRLSDKFEAPNEIDLSALHWAVGDADQKTGLSECNIHIDQVGITADINGVPAITPNLGYHTLVELLFRTGLKGHLSSKVLQAIDFVLPAAHENFALNFGTQVSFINTKDMKLSLRGMCSIHENGVEWTATANFRMTHNLLGSK